MDTMREHWENNYKRGGDSGFGSVKRAPQKWRIIERFVNVPEAFVLDIGCGDLRFWKGRDCRRYCGVDISPTIIERNKTERPDWKFHCADVTEPREIYSDVVLCFDVLLHIPTVEQYEQLLKNLVFWTDEYLFMTVAHEYTGYRQGVYPHHQWHYDFREFLYLFDEMRLVWIEKYGTLESREDYYIYAWRKRI